MPIKQVVCSICKETVNKAVTYHVGGTDRACRKHEGVEEKKIALAQAKEQKAEALIKKLERRQEPIWGPPESAMVPKCWVCMNTGLRSQEFFLRYLIECEKQSKITGKTVIPLPGFDNGVKMKTRCIFILPKEKAVSAMKFVRQEFQQLVDMAGFISICGDCCHLCKIQAMPKVDLEQIVKFAPISELIVRPAIEAQAVRELARDN